MRRRFGIPLTAALLLLLVMVQPYWPFASIEPYYVLAGVSTLLAVIDSIRLQVSKHGSSPLLSPVALAAWMLIAWPLAFPWYLKVRYHVANGESADQAGGFAAIRLAFLGIFAVGALLFVGGAAVIGKYLPGVRNYLATSLLASRSLSRQFGGPAKLELRDDRELVITMGQPRPDDSLANQRFARQVARYAHTNLPIADSLKSIEVVLLESETSKNHGRFKWSAAELRGNVAAPARPGATTAAQVAVAAAATAPKPSRVTRTGDAPTVTPAGAPAPSRPAAASRARRPYAFARLETLDPMTGWVTDSALVADIDCDGRADTVAMGRTRGEVHVGVVRSSDAEPQILVFDVGRNVKGAIGSARSALTLESLDWDPIDRGIPELPGFRRSATCKGVALGDGNGRGAHIFWSHSTRHVEWYQR